MNPLVLSGFANFISVDKRKLVIQNKLDSTRLEFYPHQINHDSIIIDGHTGIITFEAIRWLMKHDISITMLNWNGNLLGTALPQGPKSGRLRVLQYSKYLDQKVRYDIAAKIVEQKIANSYNLLKELARYYDALDAKLIEKTFAEQEFNYNQTHAYKIRNNLLMLYEGTIATFYWDCLAKVFNKLHPNFNFQCRKNKSYSWNMNASDEINAMLNYGYAILESEVRKDVNAVGLDPAVGFLHELDDSKEPLVYDLQELLRWLVDLSVIELLEEKRLKKSDFILTENYHVRLGGDIAKMLAERISRIFNRKVGYKKKNFTYQSILFDNIRHTAIFIGRKEKQLQFTIPPITLPRKDDLALRERIQHMSPNERRQLGINKSTLWYQKKKLAEGKKMTVYDKVFSKIENG